MKVLIFSAAAMLLCSTNVLAQADDAEEVRAIGERWQALYQSGAYDQIPELYTEDTLVMPRGRPAIEGREAMARAVGGLAAGRRVEIALEERELVVRPPYAWMINDFEVTYFPAEGGEPDVEYGRSLIIYQEDGAGVWRIHRDFDAPAPAPASQVESPAEGDFFDEGWTGDERTEATQCDRLASSHYVRQRLAPPHSRAEIDVPAAIEQCEADLAVLPDDARIHFHLGRLFGYSGDFQRSRFHREAAAAAGNHNAIFLLGYLDFISADEEDARCAAVTEMRRATRLGNYSAQLFYSAARLDGRISHCGGLAPISEVQAYLEAARPHVEGFFETLLVDHLAREAAAD
jgi:ketosteroid isomerase-like protein